MPATNKNNKIMVAMSGGVDSAVCASLLRDNGYDVSCAVFVFSDAGEAYVPAAQAACDSLGLPLTVLERKALFEEHVAAPFRRTYCAGRTPNPCVVCNPFVKFRTLCEAADTAGCAFIATGHYARVEQRDGVAVLRKAVSLERDQSYMLYSLTQPQLSRLVFPLGELAKPQVRETARRLGLAAADAPDSQEICFIPDGDYPGYIHARGLRGAQGRFLAPDGAVLGPHKGVEYYTIGQRRGLGIAYGTPVFVKEICENGDIRLGLSGEEFSRGMIVEQPVVNPIWREPLGGEFEVKVRSVAKPAPCFVEPLPGGTLRVEFKTPQRAPAPGQAAVFYDGEYIAAGGVIRQCFESF